jgi:two-component system response regulator HydG
LVAALCSRPHPGEALATEARRRSPDLPIILLGGSEALESVSSGLRSLSHALFEKPLRGRELLDAVFQAARGRGLAEASHRPARARSESFGNLVGDSPAMREVYALIERVATSDLPVLVTGESGTGKELVAKELHRRGARASGPFVAVNCAALPETLLESELFGHVRGAFTDARSSHEGLFCRASGGTILLDEIGDMPLGLQPKLLRALEEGAVRPLGSSVEVPFDARVVTATHQNLERAIEQRTFREDLYYRVNVIHVPLPPLRHRGTDVLLLARHLLAELAERSNRSPVGFSPRAEERLLRHEWRGNVRELRNCIERALALRSGSLIDLCDLPARVQRGYPALALEEPDGSSTGAEARQPPLDLSPAELVPLEEVERRYILHVLDACGGNKSIAARLLGLNRKTLYRRLDAFGSHRAPVPAATSSAPD